MRFFTVSPVITCKQTKNENQITQGDQLNVGNNILAPKFSNLNITTSMMPIRNYPIAGGVVPYATGYFQAV